MQVDLLGPIVLAISGFAIGFVGGMVGLVLGVARFPVIMPREQNKHTKTGMKFQKIPGHMFFLNR
jgi:hypothetical protein